MLKFLPFFSILVARILAISLESVLKQNLGSSRQGNTIILALASKYFVLSELSARVAADGEEMFQTIGDQAQF